MCGITNTEVRALSSARVGTDSPRPMWQALRTTGGVGALAIVAAHLIVGTARSLRAGQGSDWLLVVVVCMASGAVWCRQPIRKQPLHRHGPH